MSDDKYTTPSTAGEPRLPRVTIEFCTQCKWLLRAAYYAQELLSTFSTALGQVALQPSTGGVFIVTIHHEAGGGGGVQQGNDTTTTTTTTKLILWDRKVDGGFPETKILKRRVRDVIEPARHLGHVDDLSTPLTVLQQQQQQQQQQQPASVNDTHTIVQKPQNQKKDKDCLDCQ